MRPGPSFSQPGGGLSLFHNQFLGAPVQNQNHRGTSAPAGTGYDIRELLRQQAFNPSTPSNPAWGQHMLNQHNAGSAPTGQQQPHRFGDGGESQGCQQRSGSLSALPSVNVGSHFGMPTGLGLRAPSLPGSSYSHNGSSANGESS